MAKTATRIKPVNLEADTFAQMKEDLTTSLNRLLRLMQRYGEKKAEEVRKDAAADWGKEKRHDCGTE